MDFDTKDAWPLLEDFDYEIKGLTGKYPNSTQRTKFVDCVIKDMGEINMENALDHPANTSPFSMAKLIFLFDVLGMRTYLDVFFEKMIFQGGFEPSDFTQENYRNTLEEYDKATERGIFFMFDEADFEDIFVDLDDDRKNILISLMFFLQLNIQFTYDNIKHIKEYSGDYKEINNYIRGTMSVAAPREGGYKKRTKKPKSKKRKQTKTKKSKTKRKKTRRNKRR